MTSDGKRAVQPKRNEWGYPDTYDGDSYNDSDPNSGKAKWPPPPVPSGYVNKDSLDTNFATEYETFRENFDILKRYFDSVTTVHQYPRELLGDKLVPFSVTGDKIANGTLTGNKLGDKTVTTQKLADRAVSTQKIADTAVNGPKIASGAVDRTHFSAAVTSNWIMADSPQPVAKLDPTALLTSAVSKLNELIDILNKRNVVRIAPREEQPK